MSWLLWFDVPYSEAISRLTRVQVEAARYKFGERKTLEGIPRVNDARTG